MTDQTTPLDLSKPPEQQTAPVQEPAGPALTQVGTLRVVPTVQPGGVQTDRWGIVVDSRDYAWDETVTGPDGKPAIVHHAGVQDTVELLSGNRVIVDH